MKSFKGNTLLFVIWCDTVAPNWQWAEVGDVVYYVSKRDYRIPPHSKAAKEHLFFEQYNNIDIII